MSLSNSGAHRPNEPMRRQPQPDSSHPDGNKTDGEETSDIAFFFRGSFRAEARSALERAITALEQARTRPEGQKSRWLILKIASAGNLSVAATRLVDGRTFRAGTAERLIATLQAAGDET